MHGDSSKRIAHQSPHRNLNAMTEMERDRERESRASSHSRTRDDRQTTSRHISRQGVMSFLSRGETMLGSYEGDLNVRDVLLGRSYTGSQFAKAMRLRRDASHSTMYNSKRLGIILLILGCINIAMFTVLQVRRDLQAECTVALPEKTIQSKKEWIYEFTPKDCKGDLKTFQKVDKVYVFYGIENYPYHAAAAYKLHSKRQMKGKKANKKDLRVCYPFDTVSAGAVERLLYPCGMHLWNIFNDKFRFSSTNPRENPTYLKMDESFETLSRYQDHKYVRNPSDEDVQQTKNNIYYWLIDKDANLPAIPSTTPCSDTCETVHITHNSVENVKAVYDMMNAEESGNGVENGHIIQWMTAPPFKTFKKLYGVLDGPIEFPLYVTVNVAYNTSRFDGGKSITIVALSWPYGRLVSLQAILMILAVLCVILATVLLLGKPGDATSCVNLL